MTNTSDARYEAEQIGECARHAARFFRGNPDPECPNCGCSGIETLCTEYADEEVFILMECRNQLNMSGEDWEWDDDCQTDTRCVTERRPLA